MARAGLAIALALLAIAARPAGAEGPRVVICDSHHAVLRHWLQAAAEQRIPASGISVVHFDAHPDLAVPSRLPPRALLERPDAVLPYVDIASFQLAAAWLGLVDSVVWLRPDWANQIPDGVYRFRLGVTARGEARVDATADYWVLDDAWAPSARLEDPVELRLEVMSLAAAAADPSRLPKDAAILDIDLDGFATRNPAADRLRAAGLSDAEVDHLRGAFAREKLALADEPSARIRDLEAILAAAEAVSSGSLADQLGGAWRLWRFGISAGDLWTLSGLFGREDLELGPNLFSDARELVGLPERRAEAAATERTARQLASLLGPDGLRPKLISVARSANDGFTPQEAWPRIEWSLLHALGGALGNAELQLDAGLRAAPRP